MLEQQQQQIAQLTAALAVQQAPTVVANLGIASDGGRRESVARGTVRVSFGQAPLDQLQAAVDDFFGVRLQAGTALSRLRSYK